MLQKGTVIPRLAPAGHLPRNPEKSINWLDPAVSALRVQAAG